MRCLALAADLAGRGIGCHFLCRAHPGHLGGTIRAAGHYLTLMPLRPLSAEMSDRYAAWLGAGLDADAADTSEALRARRPGWVIADHYAIDARWERAVASATGAKLMALDGLANRPHDCDLLIDPTFSTKGAAHWTGLVPARCDVRVGPNYAPLRREFHDTRRARPRDGSIRRVFIAFGGVDQPNATGLALQALLSLDRHDIAADLVIGTGNPHRAALERLIAGTERIRLHVAPDRIAPLMAEADLAIGAGGTMLIEQCQMGLPGLLLSIADNQTGPIRALTAQGGAINLGALSDTNRDAMRGLIADALTTLLDHPERLAALGMQIARLMPPSAVSAADLIERGLR
jgi:UDP-2,4-diacetamido-2,4,6-trideoxy-beta-L-altropyranose hydrolase